MFCVIRYLAPPASKSDDLFHPVEAGRLADQPARRPHCALGVDRAVGRAVCQFEPLADAGEDHLMVADRVAAAQGGEADRAGLARPGNAVTAALRRSGEIDA